MEQRRVDQPLDKCPTHSDSLCYFNTIVKFQLYLLIWENYLVSSVSRETYFVQSISRLYEYNPKISVHRFLTLLALKAALEVIRVVTLQSPVSLGESDAVGFTRSILVVSVRRPCTCSQKPNFGKTYNETITFTTSI